jgi:hypothetical protein
LREEPEEQSSFAHFCSPAAGGFFGFFAGLYRGVELHLRQRAVEVDWRRRRIRFASGRCEDYDRLASSIPLPVLLGTAALILLAGWSSYLGCRARSGALLTLGVLLVVLLAALLRLRRGWLVPGLPLARWLLLLPAAAAAGLTLLPVVARHGYCFCNDAMAYISLADWLQDHSYRDPCPVDLDQPAATHNVLLYKRYELRMGSQYLLAFVEALVPGRRAVDVFLPVMAWGMVLNVLGVVLLCRWSFGLARRHAVAAAFAAAVLFNGLHTTQANGFLPQAYGLTLLSAVVAVLSRGLTLSSWRAGPAFVVGMLGAALMSAYSELLPLLAVALGGFALLAGGAAVRQGRKAELAWLLARTAVWVRRATVAPC